MLSLRRYWNGNESVLHDTLYQVVERLLQAIELHAPQGDEADYALFRSNIHALGARFTEATPPEEVLILAGEAITSLKGYGESTTRYIKTHGAEYQRMVSMLTRTLLSVTQGSERSATKLRDIEKQIERVSMVDDVRELRMKLSECLDNIKEEIEHHEANAAATAAELRQAASLGVRTPTSAASSTTDSATGLPDRSAAERALATLAGAPGNRYVVAAVADRVQAINTRFGYAVGDHVLRLVSDLFRSALSSQDHLFRWRGPAILAILERGPHIEEVRLEIARIASATFEESFEFGNRSVLLPVSASWSILPLRVPVNTLILKIDQFVAAQAPRE